MFDKFKHSIFICFSVLFVFIFTACSLISNSDNDSSLRFVIDENSARQLASRSESSADMTLTISIKGDYTQTKSAVINSSGTTQISFAAIPIGALVYVEASVRDSDNNLCYTGRSDSVTIVEGENSIPLRLTPYSEEGEEVIIYVSASGSDTTGDGSQSNPYASISGAVSGMNNGNNDYLIYVDGTLSGSQSISSSARANSITIEGLKGDSSDTLDGGFTENSTGTTLTISTAVPVTIKNLKITGGYNTNGGGISMSSGTTVKIADGTIITNNISTTHGAGIYNDGGILFVYGTALIGTASPSSIATSTSYGNKAIGSGDGITGCGGGIYSSATDGGAVYLGYSDANTKTAWTGGIYQNYSSGAPYGGGGIYTASPLYMASGSIAYNLAESTYNDAKGGGVYLQNTFTMTGGSINKNKSTCNGGGIYLNSAYSDSDTSFKEGLLYMSGSAVIGDESTSVATSDSCGNYGSYGGGGITNYGKVYLGYTDADTKATLTGGILHNYVNDGSGGGIYSDNDSQVYLASGSISYNYSGGEEYGGGAIYLCSASLTMSGGSISSNTSAGNGGGLYLSSGSLTMTAGSISSNTATSNGGGLYLSGGSFTMTAGSVKTNSAASGYTYYGKEDVNININGEQIEGTTDYDTGETTFLSNEDIEL
ncbi:MAG: hypothetical protein K6G52_04365 [Treponemataceae bacterium]|nr:hypothetical protein [Treponemataceae bacterium]